MSTSCFPMALIHYPNGAQSRLLDTASIMLSASAIRGTRLTELEPALQKILRDCNTGSRIIEILSKSDENVQPAEDVKLTNITSEAHVRVTRGSGKRPRNDENVDVDAPQPPAKRKASSHPSTSTKGKSAVTALKTSSTNKSSDEIEEVEPTYDAKTNKWLCGVCREPISRKGDMPRHMRRHMKNPPLSFCDVPDCVRQDKQKNNIKIHMADVHHSAKLKCDSFWKDESEPHGERPCRFTCHTTRGMSQHKADAHHEVWHPSDA